MAENKVTDFLIELGFDSNKVLKGLERIEKAAMKSAEKIEKALNGSFKIDTRGLDKSLNASLGQMAKKVDKTFDKIEQRAKNTKAFRFKTQIEEAVKQPRKIGVSGNRAITAAHSVNMSKLQSLNPLVARQIKAQFYSLAGRTKGMNSEQFNIEFSKLQQKLRETISKLTVKAPKNESLNNANTQLDKFAGTAARAATGIYAFRTALEMYQKILTVGLQKEAAERSAQFVLGDKGAKQAQEFVKQLADKTGVDQIETLGSYAKFSAGAGDMPTDQKQDLFQNSIAMSRLMGLSTDEINGILKAFEQMASKGKVQAEELRGQLGDRLAGAFQLFARATGMTVEQLDKAMKDGKVLSKDMLPKVAAEMGKMIDASGGWAKVASSTQTQLGKLSNTWKNDLGNIFTGSESGLNDFVRSLTTFIGSFEGGSKTLGEAFGSLMTDFSHGVDSLTDISYRTQALFDEVRAAYKGLDDAQKEVIDKLGEGFLDSLKIFGEVFAAKRVIGVTQSLFSLGNAIKNLGNSAALARGEIDAKSGGKNKMSAGEAIQQVMVVGMAQGLVDAFTKPFWEKAYSASSNVVDHFRAKVNPTDYALTGDMNLMVPLIWEKVKSWMPSNDSINAATKTISSPPINQQNNVIASNADIVMAIERLSSQVNAQGQKPVPINLTGTVEVKPDEPSFINFTRTGNEEFSSDMLFNSALPEAE